MDLDLQGKIERFTLTEILQLVAAGRKSGTLGIQRDDSIVMVYFEDGFITYGYGPRQTFHVGQLLVEQGVVSRKQLEEAIEIQGKIDNSKRLGEIMIARHFIDRADLEAVVRRQIEELLYSLLSWESGSFKFYDGQFPTQEEITVRVSVENLILEGLRRIDEKTMVQQTIPDPEAVYTISAAQAGRKRDVALDAPEWNVMALVDGYRSLADVAKASQMDPEDAMTRLAQLKLAGLITVTEKKKPDTASPKIEKMVDRLAGLFEQYLTEKSAPQPVSHNRIKTIVEAAD